MAGSALGKKASKVTKKAKKQMKNMPGRKKSPLSKVGDSLPTGGGVIAGMVGTYVMRKVAQNAKDRVKSIAGGGGDGEGGGLADTAKNLVSGGDDSSKDKAANVKLREIIQEYIDVSVSRDFAYNAWKDYESLNEVFKGIQWVEVEDGEDEGDEVKWQAKIGPSSREWGAEIKDDVEDRKIGWESTGGEQNLGIVAFHELDQNLTRIMIQMEYHPKGIVASFGNLMRMQRRRVRRDLRLFKHHVELKADEGDVPKTREEDESEAQQQASKGNGQAQSDQEQGGSRAEGSDEDNSQQGNGQRELEERSVDDLRKAASVLRVEGYKKMNKDQLIDALQSHNS